MVCLLQTATLHIEVDDLIAVLVDVGEGQSHQLPVRQLLSLIASSSSHLLRERTRVLRLAIQHTDPRIVAQHVPVGRDGGLHHLLIGHHIDESLVIIWEVGSHGQTVLLLLLVELQVPAHRLHSIHEQLSHTAQIPLSCWNALASSTSPHLGS